MLLLILLVGGGYWYGTHKSSVTTNAQSTAAGGDATASGSGQAIQPESPETPVIDLMNSLGNPSLQPSNNTPYQINPTVRTDNRTQPWYNGGWGAVQSRIPIANIPDDNTGVDVASASGSAWSNLGTMFAPKRSSRLVGPTTPAALLPTMTDSTSPTVADLTNIQIQGN